MLDHASIRRCAGALSPTRFDRTAALVTAQQLSVATGVAPEAIGMATLDTVKGGSGVPWMGVGDEKLGSSRDCVTLPLVKSVASSTTVILSRSPRRASGPGGQARE
jgi:hypothetical protein